jgi:hypothetical protein
VVGVLDLAALHTLQRAQPERWGICKFDRSILGFAVQRTEHIIEI